MWFNGKVSQETRHETLYKVLYNSFKIFLPFWSDWLSSPGSNKSADKLPVGILSNSKWEYIRNWSRKQCCSSLTVLVAHSFCKFYGRKHGLEMQGFIWLSETSVFKNARSQQISVSCQTNREFNHSRLNPTMMWMECLLYPKDLVLVLTPWFWLSI